MLRAWPTVLSIITLGLAMAPAAMLHPATGARRGQAPADCHRTYESRH